MRLDPARWPEWVLWPVLVSVALSAFACQAIGPARGPAGFAWTLVAPAIGGALIWRADAVPWADIASWTLAMTAWIVLALLVVPGPVRFIVAFSGAMLWLLVFIFWLPPVGWWYRHVLRRSMPGGRGSD